MRRVNRVSCTHPVDEYLSTNTSVGNGDLIESDEMRKKNSNLSALHRRMGFHEKKSRLISLEEETRAFNKQQKREEHLSIDISVENSKLVETDNNMVVAPSSQSATKHRVGQSVKLPGDPPRTDEISKDPEKRSEGECNKREMRLLRFQAGPTLSEKLVSAAIV